MWIIRAILYLWFIIGQVNLENTNYSLEYRNKRQVNSLPLVFPYGGTFKFIVGLATPIDNTEMSGLSFAANLQYQYAQFTNITQLSQYYYIKEVSREEREADIKFRRDERLVFYRAFANLLEAKGMHGQECVFRAICEASQYPMVEEGLIGEILHILLTPDYGRNPFEEEDPDWIDSVSTFMDAAVAGRQMFDCPSIYPACPEGQGVLELVTTLRDE